MCFILVILNCKKIGYKCMISNDYDDIIREFINFMEDVRIKCD